MSDNENLLLKTNLSQLRLPTIKAEYDKLAKEASCENATYQQYLLRLTELEVAARAANALTSRIKQAALPAHKDFDNYDFSVMPSLNKQKILELSRGEWIDKRQNCCLIGSPGTGKTHLAIALVLQRYKSSINVMRRADNLLQKNKLMNFSGGYRYGRHDNYENQTGIESIFESV